VINRLKFSAVLAGLAVAFAILPAAAAATVTIAPVHEPFTALPCKGKPSQRTTVEQEGCAEHQILTGDRRIDALNRAILRNLATSVAQRRFSTAHKAWLTYRRAYCTSRADIAPGGTQAPVLAATCEVVLNAQHIKDLRAFADELSAE
jgi:uncharacterized protein YecT (DUF1311 family)